MMTMYANEAVASSDETYWEQDDAAEPVLLIDEATEAITEALHRIRCESMLEERDVAAAGVVLGDLLGGVGQLAELLTASVSQEAGTDPLRVARWDDRLKTLGVMMASAQQVAEELQVGRAAIPRTRRNEGIPVPRHGLNQVERFSNCTPLRTLECSSADRPLSEREVRVG